MECSAIAGHVMLTTKSTKHVANISMNILAHVKSQPNHTNQVESVLQDSKQVLTLQEIVVLDHVSNAHVRSRMLPCIIDQARKA